MKPIPITIPMRAMFIPHKGFSRNMTRLDQFAEHLANGLTVPEASERMGMTNAQGNATMQKLRRRLGRQAK